MSRKISNKYKNLFFNEIYCPENNIWMTSSCRADDTIWYKAKLVNRVILRFMLSRYWSACPRVHVNHSYYAMTHDVIPVDYNGEMLSDMRTLYYVWTRRSKLFWKHIYSIRIYNSWSCRWGYCIMYGIRYINCFFDIK